MARILGNKVFEALMASGIIGQSDYVKRVVIDISINKAVEIYIERFASEGVIDVVKALPTTEITYKNVESASQPDGELKE